MATVLVEVTRGPIVESRHYGALVVADAVGTIQARAGDPALVTYLRSAAKPFQALPLVASGAVARFGLTPRELAICAASHSGEPIHRDVVAGILDKLGLGQDALRCGVIGPIDREEAARLSAGLLPPGPLYNDCSGKHSGMLATCLQRGWPLETYLELAHPLQREILGVVSAFLGVATDELAIGVDGCGVPTFAAPLASIARGYARLMAPPAGPYQEAAGQVLAAMAAHPDMVAGRGRLCTDLMTITGGRVVAKTGAEGVLCLALRERGWGVAIKVADGAARALPTLVTALLRQLDALDETEARAFEARQSPLARNKLGEPTGEFRAVFALR